jgi:hypothetical protein
MLADDVRARLLGEVDFRADESFGFVWRRAGSTSGRTNPSDSFGAVRGRLAGGRILRIRLALFGLDSPARSTSGRTNPSDSFGAVAGSDKLRFS